MRLESCLKLVAFAALACACVTARAANEPSLETPIPRVEVGGHTAFVKKLSASADGSLLLTVAADKTARLWDATNGKLLHILRVPIIAGHEGQLYAGALSPDNKVAAVGGFTGFGEAGTGTLYLFSTRSGKLVTRIKGLPAFSIENIAFAPKSNVMAICFADGAGVMFLDWLSQRFIGADRSATDKILGADFAPGGDLAITTLDGKLLVYEAASQYARLRTQELRQGKAPMHVRYSPDGAKLAIGFDRDPAFTILDAASLSSLATIRLQPNLAQRGLHVVDWSMDGKYVYVGGQSGTARSSPLLRWDIQAGGDPQPMLNAGERISDIRRLPDGAMAFTSGEPEVGVLNADGRVRWRLRGSALSFADASMDLRVSSRGDVVEFASASAGNARVRFDVNARPDQMVIRVTNAATELDAARREAAGWSVRTAEEGERLFVNGAAAVLQHREQVTTWTFTPASDRVLVGTTWFLRSYGRDSALQWSQALPATASMINVTGDGRLAVVATGDGTLRWYRLDDGVEVMALFVSRNAGDWIAWIPSGYYVSSLAGDNFIGWHVNRGWDRDPDFYRAIQFERLLYRPDLVRRHLLSRGADRLKASGDPGFDVAGLDGIAPPRLTLTTLESRENRRSATVTLDVLGESSSLPMREWALFVNGIPATPASERVLHGEEAKQFKRRVTIDLPARTNRLRVESLNGRALGFAEIDVDVDQASVAGGKGDLYIAAIGASGFADPGLVDLNFASRDAVEFASAFQAPALSQGFRSVRSFVLADSTPRHASRKNIEELAQFLAPARGEDTVIVFLASHGISDPQGNYYFVPPEGRLHDIEAAQRGEASAPSLIRWDFFVDLLRRTAGRRVLIVDTCASGALNNRFDVHTLAKRSMSSSFALVAASKGDEKSQELPAQRQGLFTYSLLQALRTGFDPDADGRVSLSEAFEFAYDEVQTLRNKGVGPQTPQMNAPQALANMPLAAADRSVTQRQARALN